VTVFVPEQLFHAKSQLEKVRVEVSASRVDDESIMPTTMSASLHSGTSFLGHRDHNSESIRGSGVLLGSQGSLAAAGDCGSVRLVPYDRDGVALAGALDAVADASDKHNAQLVRLQAEQGAKTAAAAQARDPSIGTPVASCHALVTPVASCHALVRALPIGTTGCMLRISNP
jgi:hypothetical protein